MPILKDLLNGQIFSGVPSNAVWDLIKVTWEKVTARSWEDLYLDAFEAALVSERPRLAKYSDGDIGLDRETLRQVLHYDLVAPVASLGIGTLTDEQFVASLAAALADRQALIIGGHNLSQEDYEQIVRGLVGRATVTFRTSVMTDQAAFQQALLEEALDNRELLRQSQDYLGSHFRPVLARLDDHGVLLERILTKTEEIRRDQQPLPSAESDASTVDTAATQTRSERLREMTVLSRARCIERWQAVGLTRDEAIALADDPNVGAPRPEH